MLELFVVLAVPGLFFFNDILATLDPPAPLSAVLGLFIYYVFPIIVNDLFNLVYYLAGLCSGDPPPSVKNLCNGE